MKNIVGTKHYGYKALWEQALLK